MSYKLLLPIILSITLSVLLSQEHVISFERNLLDSGITSLYNLEYEKSIKYFEEYKEINPKNSVVHFVLIAAKWQNSQMNEGYEKSYQVLNEEVDKVVPIYEALIDEYPDNSEYVLYLGSSYGLKARIALAKKEWMNVVYSGLQGYRYIRKAQSMSPGLLDIYTPIGIMEYFASQTSKPVQVISDILGIGSSSENALINLERAALSKGYSWMEASNVLTYAYLHFQRDYEKALYWITPLVEKYNKNPYFALLKLETLAKMKRWEEVDKVLPKMERYTQNGSYLQKNECQLKINYIKALQAFDNNNLQLVLELTSWNIENYHMEMDWLLGFSHLLRGKSYDRLGNYKNAKLDYQSTVKINVNYPEEDEAKQLEQYL